VWDFLTHFEKDSAHSRVCERENRSAPHLWVHLQYKPSDYQPKMLGEGAYGAILLGRDIATGEGVAIKVEPIGNSIDAQIKNSSGISYEYSVFSKLKGVKGFPIVKYFGRQQVMNRDCKVMVMELLGESVEDLWWDVTGGGRGFDVPTSLAVADEMVELLEKVMSLLLHPV
jgi:hypothetical protein